MPRSILFTKNDNYIIILQKEAGLLEQNKDYYLAERFVELGRKRKHEGRTDPIHDNEPPAILPKQPVPSRDRFDLLD